MDYRRRGLRVGGKGADDDLRVDPSAQRRPCFQRGFTRYGLRITGHGSRTMKPKIAVYWTGSCGGCDVSFLEVGEAIVEVLSQVEIVFWPALVDGKRSDLEAMPAGYIDVALINGTIRTEENVEMVGLLREKSKLVVAYGACAHMGGVPSLANLFSREEVIRGAMGESWRPGPPPGAPAEDAPPDLLPKALPLARVIPVDYTVPG
ncbi:MAG TPA: hypothetical protein ENL11_03640, partial [Candidatus Acetothermia bacterium]|nr:hypothetical protein [Candidatus Acetothermia bacterium]